MLYEKTNSWVLSLEDAEANHHYYFCRCSTEFRLHVDINCLEVPNILCPTCGNDYFKDVDEFVSMKGTKIWKYFDWEVMLSEDDEHWRVSLNYEIPTYNENKDNVILQNKEILSITSKKDGSLDYKIFHTSKFTAKYSLYLDDRVQGFNKLLLEDAKEHLVEFILLKNSTYKSFFTPRVMENTSLSDKLKYLSEIQKLDSIVRGHKEKNLKKTLYKGYEDSLKQIGYYPDSDYLFSKSIDNVDLLNKLYSISASIKKDIFLKAMFGVDIEFISFLKKHYTEKQIAKLFIQDLKDGQEIETNLSNWRDILRMLSGNNAIEFLEEHFVKVKLNINRLHDEIVRVFHIVAYELDAKENFEYSKRYLSACTTYEKLEFKLPLTVKELSIWSKILHNCMFSYSKAVHNEASIIYGVFKEKELVYAVEVKNLNLLQAKAIFNGAIPENDKNIIRDWHSYNFNI